MGKFLHIYIKANKDITQSDIEQKMNLAVDWYRYDNNIYIIYTTSIVDKWLERLRELVNNGGALFICQLQSDTANGMMTQDFWKWLKKERNK